VELPAGILFQSKDIKYALPNFVERTTGGAAETVSPDSKNKITTWYRNCSVYSDIHAIRSLIRVLSLSHRSDKAGNSVLTCAAF
jgi:hypothetical protein